MGTSGAKLSQQHALFMGARNALLPELEAGGFTAMLRQEAVSKEWYDYKERSQSAILSFSVANGEFCSLLIRFNDPKLGVLYLGPAGPGFDEHLSGAVLLSDERRDALFEAFLDECRRLFQRHRIRLSPAGRRFFLPK